MYGHIASPYLHTRVSLMSRRLATPALIEKAIETPLAELAPVLAAVGAEALAAEPSEELPRSLEQRRLSRLLNDILILARAQHGEHRDFLLYWTHSLELFNLKAILRGRLDGENAARVRDRLLDMGPFAALPVDALLRADSEAEVLRLLEATPFAEFAAQARRVLAERRDPFFIDTALDRRFYSGLAKRAAKIHTSDAVSFRRLMASLIDGLNFMWLARYRLVYRLPPPETWYLLIPAGYDLPARHLKRLTAAEDLATLIASTPRPLGPLLTGADSIEEAGRRIELDLRNIARGIIRRSVSGFVRSFCYLLLRSQDLITLRGVVKAKQLGLSPDVVRTGLLRHVRPEEAGRV